MTSSLKKVQNIESHVLPPLLNPRTNSPPPPVFAFLEIIAVENKYSVLGLPGNKLSGRVRDENK